MAEKKNKYQEMKESVNQFLHSDNPFANTLGYVEKYTKVDRKYIALGQSPFILVLPMPVFLSARCELLVVSLSSSLSPVYVAMVSFVTLYIMIGWGAALVVNLIGFVYPAYASYVYTTPRVSLAVHHTCHRICTPHVSL